MQAHEDDLDFQELMPESLRPTWVALPKPLLYQLFLVGVLFGAGTGITVYAYVVGSAPGKLGFVIALGLAVLQNRLIPWDRRARGALRAWRERKG
jgi:hypothetical protein